ncbi:uncharacterized protein LOC111714551 isoform X2 [Eurytemora carolleeae]|uniref:uncharacterized protein LOC111714551 isoform X2 n=1 Tax=Eurytemora carolleeae TaxID=1294199 RepID=UPI000C77FCE2|nr:uncharacterized protein LOC111714551 isoform X2 [Eurytemora carolleeae]|eukprot:XP_023345451.1 uncharacterized protein LOC111714551 isoform X2 [Eurytemora affinis]
MVHIILEDLFRFGSCAFCHILWKQLRNFQRSIPAGDKTAISDVLIIITYNLELIPWIGTSFWIIRDIFGEFNYFFTYVVVVTARDISDASMLKFGKLVILLHVLGSICFDLIMAWLDVFPLMAKGGIVYAMASEELFYSLPEVPRTQALSQGTYILFTIIYQISVYLVKRYKFRQVLKTEAASSNQPRQKTTAISALASILVMGAGCLFFVNHFYVIYNSKEENKSIASTHHDLEPLESFKNITNLVLNDPVSWNNATTSSSTQKLDYATTFRRCRPCTLRYGLFVFAYLVPCVAYIFNKKLRGYAMRVLQSLMNQNCRPSRRVIPQVSPKIHKEIEPPADIREVETSFASQKPGSSLQIEVKLHTACTDIQMENHDDYDLIETVPDDTTNESPMEKAVMEHAEMSIDKDNEIVFNLPGEILR